MNTHFDFIVLGQGLAGTWLSYYLMEAGKKVLVIDKHLPGSSSMVASGVINPITGRRLVRTWRIEELLPFAANAYAAMGRQLNCNLVKETGVLEFFTTPQMQDSFAKRMAEQEDFLQWQNEETDWKKYFNFNFSAGKIAPALYIDLQLMLGKWREELKQTNSLLEEYFDENQLVVKDDLVSYDTITAGKIFFCDGIAGMNNAYFSILPYSAVKGEALIVSIPGLPRHFIYKHGFSIVPWKEDSFWVGSSYEWNFTHLEPTDSFRKRCTQFLDHFVKLPYSVQDHLAGCRPANVERRPFVGMHPLYKNVGILNGMGTKGCSLAPFFAIQLVQLVLNDQPVYPEADVCRFKNILLRSINKN